MTDRFEPDLWPGLGLIAGAALGTALMLLVDTALLAIGIALGAALGLVVGAILRANHSLD